MAYSRTRGSSPKRIEQLGGKILTRPRNRLMKDQSDFVGYLGACSSVVRAPLCGRGSRGFDSRQAPNAEL